jgi:hypothetical protein
MSYVSLFFADALILGSYEASSMFNVKVDSIREQTTNGPTYMKGRTYYRNGLVRSISYDVEKGLIQAQVAGTQTYAVRIILNGSGLLHDASCTCSAFTAYWGFCKHITAVLLYCVDAYGQGNTHITPLHSPITDAEQSLSIESADSCSNQNKASRPAGPPAASTEPVSIGASVLAARQQLQRKSRLRTRDFLTRINRLTRVRQVHDHLEIQLEIVLYCATNASTLPYISLSVVNERSHPIPSLEQFVEAIAHELPLEIDREWTYDPLIQSFAEDDRPLLELLLDAYENDYKATFGSSQASSRGAFLVLNASRFAQFLRLAANRPNYTWRTMRQSARQMIRLRQEQLPIQLALRPADGPEDHLILLELESGSSLMQLTASRNVYLVDDIFYLPPRDCIRLLEPVLSVFAAPGVTGLYLTPEETADFIGEVLPILQPVCPVQIDPALQHRLVQEDLQATVTLESMANGLKADVHFRYGAAMASPDDMQTISRETPVIIRQRAVEQKVIDFLAAHDFKHQGAAYRLSDSEQIFNFLNEGLPGLRKLATVEFSENSPAIQVLPAPRIRIGLHLRDHSDSLWLQTDWDNLPAEERQLYSQALRERRTYYLTRQGNYRRVNEEQRLLLLPLLDQLEQWGVEKLVDELALPRYRILALDQLLQAAGQQARTGEQAGEQNFILDEAITQMASHLREPGSLNFRLPQTVRGTLRPYQKIGFQWLCTLDYYGLGGILADDMGLGKTLQTIAYIAYQFKKRHRPALIIAPTSLVYNWQREFEQFAPDLPVLVSDGNRQQRTARLESIQQYACVITSYSLVRRDIEDISSIHFSSCFLDEAQNIKNPETLNARTVKQVVADRTFALTGTPIENSLTELWSIFDFIMPGYLLSQRQFQTQFELPLMRDNRTELLTELHQQISPFILRRMKKDVLRELPDKIETRTVCDMTSEQRELYETYLRQSRMAFEHEVTMNGFARSQIYILALLTRLRQICCHPGLFLKQYTGGSGKLLLLEELLADCTMAGHRVLVFSQFTHMLDLIRERQLALGQSVFYIDGQVSAEERLLLVERFNAGEGNVFLISLRAGGTGLNLTGADTVIHYDPWWNPAVEDQATDRAYRIGQENVVQVFKLYTRHTIEEKIQALQEKKQSLIDAIIKPGQNLLSQMTLDEVRGLFEP